MAGLCLSYRWLSFRTPTVHPSPPLPDGITRHFVPTPSGTLELLQAVPSTTTSATTPILFLHGGMGGAWVWHEYMTMLASHGVPSYALSLRGHGQSWKPSYLRMVFFTSRVAFEDDVLQAVAWMQKQHGVCSVVLAGHSAGGGLLQAVLARGGLPVQVNGLAVVAAIPGYGAKQVFAEWFSLLDRWANIRLLLHFFHPNSTLSHPTLVRRAFFSPTVDRAFVERFMTFLAPYENLPWPLSMRGQFVDPQRVVKAISGWTSDGSEEDRILVLTGENDAIIRTHISVRHVAFYRTACAAVLGRTNGNAGVRYETVLGAAHHVQNDVGWEKGAQMLLEWYLQL